MLTNFAEMPIKCHQVLISVCKEFDTCFSAAVEGTGEGIRSISGAAGYAPEKCMGLTSVNVQEMTTISSPFAFDHLKCPSASHHYIYHQNGKLTITH